MRMNMNDGNQQYQQQQLQRLPIMMRLVVVTALVALSDVGVVNAFTSVVPRTTTTTFPKAQPSSCTQPQQQQQQQHLPFSTASLLPPPLRQSSSSEADHDAAAQPEEAPPAKLILETDTLQNQMAQLRNKYPTSESAYLAAARERAKAKVASKERQATDEDWQRIAQEKKKEMEMLGVASSEFQGYDNNDEEAGEWDLPPPTTTTTSDSQQQQEEESNQPVDSSDKSLLIWEDNPNGELLL